MVENRWFFQSPAKEFLKVCSGAFQDGFQRLGNRRSLQQADTHSSQINLSELLKPRGKYFIFNHTHTQMLHVWSTFFNIFQGPVESPPVIEITSEFQPEWISLKTKNHNMLLQSLLTGLVLILRACLHHNMIYIHL